jgi:Cu2+-containing amine oxidase
MRCRGWRAGRVDQRRVIAARLPIYVVQAEAVQDADLVIWMGADLTP